VENKMDGGDLVVVNKKNLLRLLDVASTNENFFVVAFESLASVWSSADGES
jgi:hypothetical protein